LTPDILGGATGWRARGFDEIVVILEAAKR